MTSVDNTNNLLKKLYEKLLEDEEWRKKLALLLREKEEYVRRDELSQLLEELKKQREDFNKRFEAMASKDDLQKVIEMMEKRFEAVDRRFEAMASKDDLQKVIEMMEKRFEAVDRRFEDLYITMNNQFGKVFKRLDALSESFGHDFEEFNSYWLETFLISQGYPKIDVKKKTFYDENYEVFPDSKEIEVDLFNESPLVIGEVTAIVRRIDKVTTFLRKVSFLEKRFGKAKHKLFITYSVVSKIRDEAIELLKKADVDIVILRKRSNLD